MFFHEVDFKLLTLYAFIIKLAIRFSSGSFTKCRRPSADAEMLFILHFTSTKSGSMGIEIERGELEYIFVEIFIDVYSFHFHKIRDTFIFIGMYLPLKRHW